MFQSTRPYGARRHAADTGSITISFNPRARTGRDGMSLASLSMPARVSIHAPVRGATSIAPTLDVSDGFNPRARTGRDAVYRHRRRRSYEFQSTRPYGARRARRRQFNRSPSFNPRARTGRDVTSVAVESQQYRVSIHAPVRGATSGVSANAPLAVFQSTRPYGARPMSTMNVCDARCFNPRARTGRDRDSVVANVRARVSIHAPVRGATRSMSTSDSSCRVSIHAPVRGATESGVITSRSTDRFQSTRPYGARRHRITTCMLDADVSIHAPVRGATSYGSQSDTCDMRFNPRARTGRDLSMP